MADTLAVFICAGLDNSMLSKLAFGGMPMLPFGGRMRFIDYALNNAVLAKADAVSVIDGTSSSVVAEYCSGGWRARGVRYYAERNICSALMQAFHDRSAARVLIVSADAPAYFDIKAVRSAHAERKVNLIAQGKERYAVSLSQRLFSDAMKKMYRQELPSGNVIDALVPPLEREFGAANAVVPKGFFGARPSSVYQYYRAVIDRIPHFQNIYAYTSREIATWIVHEPESHIERSANVERTIVADSDRIGGDVSSSVIAGHVVIEKGASVVNSIILPGNVIARGASIVNAVIGENDASAQKSGKTVHENAHIGAACKGAPGKDDAAAVLAGVIVPRNARIPGGSIITAYGARESTKEEME
ncbi:MAG: hypothetical protein AABZ39_07660 [Spirochaetota bacterium]